ncbi:MAG TPA: hypothetical protein PLA50_00315 [Bacteroidia bacterium]|nr:hypothetical protein [Bacteroidia bacterium]
MPDLTLGHKNTLFGEVVITGLLKNLTNPHAADSYYTWAASGATYPGDASFSAAAIKTLGYKAAWGASSPWSEFYTEEGFKITFNSTFDPSPADGHGTIDMRLSGLTVEATATPVGLSPANVLGRLKFQGAGNELGGTKAGGDHLVITNQVGASQLYFLLSAPTLKQSPVRFGSKVRGVGELVWSSTRTMTAGSPDPLFYLGTAAP